MRNEQGTDSLQTLCRELLNRPVALQGTQVVPRNASVEGTTESTERTKTKGDTKKATKLQNIGINRRYLDEGMG